MMRAGENLSGVVATYLNSLEFSRRALSGPAATDEIAVTSTEGFEIYSSMDDVAVGKYVRRLDYERDVTAVFRRFVRDGMTVVDIGANIGYFSLLSALLVGRHGRVFSVEPNPRNIRLLEASRRANGFEQITVLQMAAGRESGLLTLHTSHSNGTTSNLPPGVDALLAAETVPSIRLDSLLANGIRVDFIKADVEGAEYNALLGCEATIRRDRPIIVSEFSPDLMPGISAISGEAYLEWLVGLGYDLSVIEPDGGLAEAGRDCRIVLDRYRARGTDHIDIVATPV